MAATSCIASPFSLPLALLVALAGSLLAARALACSCPLESLESRICRGSLAALATVAARYDSCAGAVCGVNSAATATYVLRVWHVVRGPAPDDGVLFARASAAGNLCGLPFAVGDMVLVNALAAPALPPSLNGAPPTYDINLCDGSAKWSDLQLAARQLLFSPSICAAFFTTAPATTTTITTTNAGGPATTVATAATTQGLPIFPPPLPVLPGP